MYTKQAVLMVAVIAMLCVSCSEDNQSNPLTSSTIKGSGVLETESRTVGDFDELTLSAAGKVNITFGVPQSVTVTVDDNIMPYLQTGHSGSHLDIRVQDGIDARDYDLVVDLVVADLKALELAGVGSMGGHNTLQTEHIDLALTGAGTIDLDVEVSTVSTLFSGPGSLTLTGTADTHTCEMSSAGDLHAFELSTGTTDVTLSGVGSAEVNVSESLDANLSGLGSVYYRGNPTITGTDTGLGGVIDAN
ncbi:MAG: DUF2807 domain-containing protein [candidate division Zixibacteria bacterium]|nr:DUF2807 domain-containing protein [candidate division Zixibacteria bacterium]MDH4032375.1 DUF2807 domain-containing protein [candidate division Zixibacteria bacterium]